MVATLQSVCGWRVGISGTHWLRIESCGCTERQERLNELGDRLGLTGAESTPQSTPSR